MYTNEILTFGFTPKVDQGQWNQKIPPLPLALPANMVAWREKGEDSQSPSKWSGISLMKIPAPFISVICPKEQKTHWHCHNNTEMVPVSFARELDYWICGATH